MQILLGQRAARVLRLVPYLRCAPDAQNVVLGPFAAFALRLDGGAVEALDARGRDAPVLLVAWIPRREAEALAHVVLADERIVARVREHHEAARGSGVDLDAE